jgi:hypothetical protein
MERIIDLNKIIEEKKSQTKEKKPSLAEKQDKEDEKEELPLSLNWEAPEYEYIEKSPDWFWAVAIIAAGFIFLAYFFRNIILGVLIFLMAFVVMLYGARKPRLAKFLIDWRGITINSRFYPYENLKSFWIHYDPPHHKELVFISKKLFMPLISIPLAEADPNKIREILIKYLEERHQELSFIDVLAKFFRF